MHIKDLVDRLSFYRNDRMAFMGLGNELREDDWSGIYLLRKIRALDYFHGALFIEAGISPENYLSFLIDHKPEVLVFIDSVHSYGQPGDTLFLSADKLSEFGFSTHSYSVKMLEDYIKYLSTMDILYLGIVPNATRIIKGLSPVLKESMNNFFNM